MFAQPEGFTLAQFQFLGRNSGRSDPDYLLRSIVKFFVSIPRSEFWSFGHKSFDVGIPSLVVSIPRSEFWSFGLSTRGLRRHNLTAVSIPRSEFWSFGRGRRPLGL